MSDIIIAEKGKTEYILVLPQNFTPQEKVAADAFAELFHGVTGAEIVRGTDDTVYENEILIGATRRTAALPDDLGDDGFVTRVSKGRVEIAGGIRGTIYGVYDLFEKYADCRWFTYELRRIPLTGGLTLPEMDEKYTPHFVYRDTYYPPDAVKAAFALPNKHNGVRVDLDRDHGSHIMYAGPDIGHTVRFFVPVSEFGESHPEYFSLIDGKRKLTNTQLCLTNPDVFNITRERVLEWCEKYPDAKIISVSQDDNTDYCRCPACAAIDAEEGSHMGSLLRFVNAVADAVKDRYPDRMIDTFAYQYTRNPPKITKPRDNVIIRLCSIECCFSHTLEACDGFDHREGKPFNKSFADDIKGWSKIAKTLYVWDYTVNFSHYIAPFPNLRVLQKNIQFFRAHNVRGMFEQGSHSTHHGEFAELKSFLIAHLLWNPDCDVEALTAEFLEAYYGAAAPMISKYIDILHDKAERENYHYTIFMMYKEEFFTDAFMSEASDIFDRAEKAVLNDPDALRHVQTARMAIKYLAAMRRNGMPKTERKRMIDEFLDDCVKYGIDRCAETLSLEDTRALCYKEFEIE